MILKYTNVLMAFRQLVLAARRTIIGNLLTKTCKLYLIANYKQKIAGNINLHYNNYYIYNKNDS